MPESEYDYKEFYGRIHEPFSILEMLPLKPTIIVIKDKIRAAKTLCDTYVGVVYEYPTKTYNASTVVQSLPGRFCGWGKKTGPCAPIIYTHVQSIKDYIQLVKNKFDYAAQEQSYKSATINKKKNKQLKAKESAFHPNLVNGVKNITETNTRPVSPNGYRIYKGPGPLYAVNAAKYVGKHPHWPKPEDGWYKTSLNATRRVHTLDEVIAKIPTLTGGAGNGRTVRTVLCPCYKDKGDQSTLRFVVILPETFPVGKSLSTLDEAFSEFETYAP